MIFIFSIEIRIYGKPMYAKEISATSTRDAIMAVLGSIKENESIVSIVVVNSQTRIKL